MRRWIAMAWHSSFLVVAAALYFLFVLPRWFELTGAWPVGLGTPLRIVCGLLVGLSALPVVFTLIHTRRPEFGTPQLALTMRSWSIVLHIAAGVLIAGAAVAEIWVSLDSAGQWLFGCYGAAAALAILAALGFHLAYVAEQPPPPPRPLKAKAAGKGRGRKTTVDGPDETVEQSDADATATDASEIATTTTETAEPDELVDAEKALESDAPTESDGSDVDVEGSDPTNAKLRNRRPRRLGRRGGLAVDE